MITAFTSATLPNGTVEDALWLWCPGCQMPHQVVVTGPRVWDWDGDRDRPVITPSLLARWTDADGDHTCHSFIGCNGAAPGQIVFLGDSTHDLAGQVVNLPEYPPEWMP